MTLPLVNGPYVRFRRLRMFLIRAVFLGTAKSFQLRIEIADKRDIVGKVVDSFKQPKVWISIWAVSGSQN